MTKSARISLRSYENASGRISRRFSADQLNKLCRYFTVLRLALPRATIKDIEYEGVTLEKGTVIFLNAWACNMGKIFVFRFTYLLIAFRLLTSASNRPCRVG